MTKHLPTRPGDDLPADDHGAPQHNADAKADIRQEPGRLFAGVYPAGIVYADRKREEHGDYKRLAFLPFDSLVLTIEHDCPAALRAEIEADAAKIIARRGEQYQVSTCGQTVTLGGGKC